MNPEPIQTFQNLSSDFPALFHDLDLFQVLKQPYICLFVALRPRSTAMVMAGLSIHLTTLFFLGKLEQAVKVPGQQLWSWRDCQFT